MPESSFACHTHSLRDAKLERNPKSIIRSLLDNLKNEKPSFSSSKSPTSLPVEEFSDEESQFQFSQSLIKKYGTCREIVGSGGTSMVWRGNLNAVEADCFIKQMMRGIHFLHENGIAHRDLKLENMVLTKRGTVKIAEFGESERFRIADVEIAILGGVCGSSPYIAPEVYTSDYYCARSADVWSMGVIYMTMRLGRYLWIAARPEDKFYTQYAHERRTEGGYAPIENVGKAECNNVVYSLLDPRADRRLTASQFLRTEWGRSIQLYEAAREDA